MAERRMFAKTIIDSDLFLDMPLTTQALYFHLSMRADDDGFINNPKKIIRMVGCSEDELRLLIAKQFVIPFESGICVIKHWKIHNYIRNDRYKETNYIEEKSQLELTSNNAYEKKVGIPSGIPDDNQVAYQMDTQVRLGKVRLGKDNNSISKDILVPLKLEPIVKKWNSLGLQEVKAINPGTNRYKLLSARVKEFGIDKILETIESINKSSFLKGQNHRGWAITFDWLIKPNNFVKVMEGNYLDKEGVNNDITRKDTGTSKIKINIPKGQELTEEDRKRAEQELI